MLKVFCAILKPAPFSVNSSTSPFPYSQVDRLEDELMDEQEKYKLITEELEQTFAEMSGY